MSCYDRCVAPSLCGPDEFAPGRLRPTCSMGSRFPPLPAQSLQRRPDFQQVLLQMNYAFTLFERNEFGAVTHPPASRRGGGWHIGHFQGKSRSVGLCQGPNPTPKEKGRLGRPFLGCVGLGSPPRKWNLHLGSLEVPPQGSAEAPRCLR